VTLGDTGPLVALIDADDPNHQRCMEALPGLRRPLVTTWPCLTEALYLLDQAGGHRAQEALWTIFEQGVAQLHPAGEAERRRARVLMARYRDIPMDLADASIVTAAETLELRRVFTLDRHFYAYRFRDREPFLVTP
jgi:predicted nucleic acid-binding protein